MAIEHEPKHRVPRGYVPPNYKPYKVKDGDSWVTVAQRVGMDVWDLIEKNFKSRDPREINWYLRTYVGCKKQTADGKNWMFSSSADPGVIYLPAEAPPPPEVIEMPPVLIEGRAESRLRTVWAGLGKAHSGDLFVVGAHDLTARIYNLGSMDDDVGKIKNATININGYKFGLGLGGDISGVFVIAHGYEEAKDMVGVDGGWDFDVALVAKLSDFLKGVKGLGRAVETYEKYKKLKYLTENAIKSLGIAKPGIYTVPIPFAGWGLHLWGGYKFGDVNVFSSGQGLP